MGRYYYNKRSTTDEYYSIEMPFFTKYGYLKDGITYKSGGLIWKTNGNENGSMSFAVTKNDDTNTGYIRVYFTQTDRATQEKKDIDYSIRIIATPCHFGWRRWWFLDPCSDKPLRCATLYLQSNWAFASRKTLNLAYKSQNDSYSRVLKSQLNGLRAIMLIEKIKYRTRNGKFTKKMQRVAKYAMKWPSALGYTVDDLVADVFGGKYNRNKYTTA